MTSMLCQNCGKGASEHIPETMKCKLARDCFFQGIAVFGDNMRCEKCGQESHKHETSSMKCPMPRTQFFHGIAVFDGLDKQIKDISNDLYDLEKVVKKIHDYLYKGR